MSVRHGLPKNSRELGTLKVPYIRRNQLEFVRREAAAETPLDERGALDSDGYYGDFTKDAWRLG